MFHSQSWPTLWLALQGLQVLQYLVIDECGSKANQLVTLLGVIHIAFQPLVVNIALFGKCPSTSVKSVSPPQGACLVIDRQRWCNPRLTVTAICVVRGCLRLQSYCPAAVLCRGVFRGTPQGRLARKLICVLTLLCLLQGALAPQLAAACHSHTGPLQHMACTSLCTACALQQEFS